ncbi:PAS domain S-box protein, partial [Halorhodospira halochloris]|uniref:PAS domain S-box protein n=1 Tax=Halorhodospira halochloris TaxID=1052 RepID=UPI001EE84855
MYQDTRGSDVLGHEKHRSADFFQGLLEKQPAALCTLDSAGCFTYLNTAACQLLGYPDESALLGVNFTAVVDAERTPLPADTVTERLVAFARNDEPLCGDTPIWLQPRAGAAFPVAIEAAALHSGQTAAGDVMITFCDRTAQHEREQELANLREANQTKSEFL